MSGVQKRIIATIDIDYSPDGARVTQRQYDRRGRVASEHVDNFSAHPTPEALMVAAALRALPNAVLRTWGDGDYEIERGFRVASLHTLATLFERGAISPETGGVTPWRIDPETGEVVTGCGSRLLYGWFDERGAA